jgi:hypothetical protein
MGSKKVDKGKSKTKGNAKKGRSKQAAAAAAAANGPAPARAGDVIVLDSAQVGSPAREGEIVSVIERDVTVSYRVRWGDGHESLISPGAGSAHVIRREHTDRP